MSKRFIVILALCIAIFVGIVIVKGQDSDKSNDTPAVTTSHSQGTADAKVTLTEYGDFQCPACAGYYSIIKEVKAKYGDKINFQFRHFPIVSIHPNAMTAHRAAEAAGKQNKFWEMHDALYERQQNWATSSNPSQIFEDYAKELELNIDQYKKDVADISTKDTIEADFAEGESLGVSSTPSFVINGKKLDNNPRDAAGFGVLIDEILNQQ